MIGKHKPAIGDLFRSNLNQILNLNHELVLLSKEVDWTWIENELSVYYSDKGRPSVPIRTMVGMLLLKHLYNRSDESVVAGWVENPYWQYFTGESFFQHEPPFNPTDFVHFRKRIGEEGMEKILTLTVKLHPEAAKEEQVQFDTTVQEKNISYPTDTKLQRRIMSYLRTIAEWEDLDLRQSYVRIEKRLLLAMRFGHHPKHKKVAQKARRKFKTITGRLLRDVQRKLDPVMLAHYQPYLDLYAEVLAQKRSDKNKIYSLHEPHVKCISKGKAHKKYEFGNKVGITRGCQTGVILGVKSYTENIYDGHALPAALAQSSRILEQVGGQRPKEAIVDRGCRGRKQIEGTKISIPSRPTSTDTKYQKTKKRKKFRSRAAIEPIIGHLKHDHRMLRNYLSGTIGDAINAMAAGCAFNIKMRLRQIKMTFFSLVAILINTYHLRTRSIGQHQIAWTPHSVNI